MTAFNSVPTLRCSCLNFFLSNLDQLFEDDRLRYSLSRCNVQHLFDELMSQARSACTLSTLVEFVARFGGRLETVRINLKMRTLKWSDSNNSEPPIGAKLLSALHNTIEPTTIRQVDLYDGPLVFGVDQLCDTIGAWHQLTSLRLIVRHLDDRLVRLVAQNCVNLVELHLLGSNYSDCAIATLAGCNSSNVGCRKLRRLSFFATEQVSAFTTAAIHILLLNLPELVELQVGDKLLGETLITLMTSSNKARQLSLATIDVNLVTLNALTTRYATAIKHFSDSDQVFVDNNVNNRFDHLFCALAFLPNLQKLTLTISNPNELEPKVLCRFRKLSTVVLNVDSSNSVWSGDNVSFGRCEQFVHRLLTHVQSLTCLELQNIVSVDMDVLVRMCPALKRLQLINVVRLRCGGRETHRYRFERLHELCVCADEDNELEAREVEAMLCLVTDTLELLSLGWLGEALSDQVLCAVLQHNPMKALHSVELHEAGHCLTIDALRVLVFGRVRPLVLNICQCPSITRHHIRQLRTQLTTHNPTVTIKYYDAL